MSQDPAVLAVRITALENALKHFTEVNQQNQGALKQAFLFTDAHLFVLKELCTDIVAEKVAKTETGEIDMPLYYKRFNEHYAKQREAPADRPPEQGLGDTQAEESSEPIEFGGDVPAPMPSTEEAAHVPSP